MSWEHERHFAQRVSDTQARLKRLYPNINWVLHFDEDGDAHLLLTEKVLDVAGGNGTRALVIQRPVCQHCGESHRQHQPPGGKCLFGATSYEHSLESGAAGSVRVS
jgi:hypothetical protein